MNFLSLGLKTLKLANKAKQEQIILNEVYKSHGLEPSIDPEFIKERKLEDEFKKMEEAFDIGLKYYQMAKEKLKSNGGRTYLLTIRPPHNIQFNQFQTDCLFYINKWSNKWLWWEYAYEQKGNSAETIGHGFHIHILFETNENNYYPSHIIRNTNGTFKYVANNCIDCQTVKNITRAKEYIRGAKNDSNKQECIEWDIEWRRLNNLKNLYTNEEPTEVKSNALLVF